MVHNRPPLGILFLEFVECLFFARSNADICKYPFVLLQLLAKPELLEHRNARDVANNMRNNAKKYWGKIVPSPVSDLQTIKQSSRSCISLFCCLSTLCTFSLKFIYLNFFWRSEWVEFQYNMEIVSKDFRKNPTDRTSTLQ